KCATIPFLVNILKAEAILVFGLTKNGSELVVQIQTSIQKWTWSDSFPFMQGWPFDQLAVSGVQFVFSTAQGQYPWTDSSGLTLAGGAKQNFLASLALPD